MRTIRRTLSDLDGLLAVKHDEHFVAARHRLQVPWRIGTLIPEHQRLLVARLTQRFREAAVVKNGALVRYD